MNARLPSSQRSRLLAIAAAVVLCVHLSWIAATQVALSMSPTPHAGALDLHPHKSVSLKTSLPPDVLRSLPDEKPTGESKGVNTGNRELRLAQRQILSERGSLGRGDRQLDDNSYYDLYRFEGRAGQQVRIELNSTDFDTYLILLDTNGEAIAENDDRSRRDSNALLDVTLQATGEYGIVANSYDSRGRGNYTLTVTERGSVTPEAEPQPSDSGNTPSPLNSRPVSITGSLSTLAEADRLYLQGNISAAEELYRRAKPDFLIGANPQLLDERQDVSQLSPEALDVWTQTQSAIEHDRESEVEHWWPRLIQAAPGFVDGQLATADYLIEENEEEMVIEQLEELAIRFPEDVDIARLHVKALREDRQRLEASIAARQFAIANPEHPESSAFNNLADEYMGDFRRVLRERIALQGLGSVAIGVLTGRTNSAIFNGIQLAQLMATGESGIGDLFSNQVKQQSKIIDDPEAVDYINTLGQDVAQRMGRDEFDYEFYIIEDDSMNAFALPGGKVFIHTGALAAAHTEAELVGLLGHEVGHAVLSHGFKRIVRGQLIASLARDIPLGNVLYTLVGLDYSREHERQSDVIGTRVLANTGYAADGLRNFMATLGANNPQRVPEYLSTHPAPVSRVQYLEELVVRNSYNRYSFEGVERLARIQARLGLPAHNS